MTGRLAGESGGLVDGLGFDLDRALKKDHENASGLS